MSVVNNNLLLTADAGVAPSAYQISRSLRFNSPDSAYLNRTPSVAGNQQKWTWSAWIKKNKNGTLYEYIFDAAASMTFGFYLDTFFFYDSNIANYYRISTQLFKDPAAWYHFVVVFDSANATLQNRLRIYVNGSEITSWTINNGVPLNINGAINSTSQHCLGGIVGYTFSDTYLADVHFIGGQALTPSSFTETNATTGQLVPKAYSGGSYGTNGFRLNFSDNSAATAATLGADSSGNGNNWTPNNLSVTAGAGNDSLTDTPTSYGTDSSGTGGEVRGNYATLNPLSTLTTVTLANGNLDYSSTTASRTTIATIGVSSGKWYWEASTTAGTTETQVGIYGTSASTLFSLAANSTVYGIRFNADTGALDRTSDGVTFTSIATGLTSGPYFPYFNNNGTTSKVVSVNFGQRPFAYAAPSGFKALCDTNLPTPTIAKGSSVFDTTLYTGTGAALTPTSSLAFSPDLVWIKGRSGATDHALYDTVRGATLDLVSNSTVFETTQTQGLTAFNSNGFSVGTLAKLNTSAATYAGWCWDAGSSTVTNTAGTITSQVRANVSAGFSVVTYTGGASNSTVGHGLGSAPNFIIAKSRFSSGYASSSWDVYNRSLGKDTFLYLERIDAAGSYPNYWGSVEPTSTVFGVSVIDFFNNRGNMVAYCFAPVTGYSSFGSYTGNGSAAGTFVYLGFRPAFLMIKRTDTTGNWVMLDGKRAGYNVDNDPLYANLGNAEATTDLLDITSNGFKLRSTNADCNASGGTYVYACFAENPFQYARAR